MSEIVNCEYNECVNLTTNSHSEYGCYCFQHTPFTHRPRKFFLKSKRNNIFNSKVLVMSNSSEFIEIKDRASKTKSMVRMLPLPENKKISYVDSYQTTDCIMCSDPFPIKYTMQCGHLMCDDCLNLIRKNSCPGCGSKMKGVLVTKEVEDEIDTREKEDAIQDEIIMDKIKSLKDYGFDISGII